MNDTPARTYTQQELDQILQAKEKNFRQALAAVQQQRNTANDQHADAMVALQGMVEERDAYRSRLEQIGQELIAARVKIDELSQPDLDLGQQAQRIKKAVEHKPH